MKMMESMLDRVRGLPPTKVVGRANIEFDDGYTYSIPVSVGDIRRLWRLPEDEE